MDRSNLSNYWLVTSLAAMLSLAACAALPGKEPAVAESTGRAAELLPASYPEAAGPASSAEVDWREFFGDPYLAALIDAAIANNQELNILMQEIAIARNEVDARAGEYLPFVSLGAGAGTEKVGRFTRNGAVEENLPLRDGESFREPLPDFMLGISASWEIDIWNRLRNAKKAAVLRYLATQEGRNFMQTHLVAEIADAYFELLALDNSLLILERMLEIQQQALSVVRLQKAAARATELAVRRFEAEVLKNQSQLFEMRQQIVEVENRLNFLAGRYPQPIERQAADLENYALRSVSLGQPSELLANRPDVRQAELELAAAKLDVSVARARFYPSLDISAALGLQTAASGTLLSAPESVFYNLAGEVMMPLFNKQAIRAAYNNATASQLQALYRYQQIVLNAYVEVANQWAMIRNIGESHSNKSEQVAALTESVAIADRLYRSARAEYTEVLLTQRDALESRMELVELRQQQFSALVNMYQALGGGYAKTVEGES
ncbi:MAG: efflux transporter outer membrane subunit [Gammaproteobacteria bacterium]|jgi:NodT family efflux transporter outer membrane factor (OMF) lipoprotein|nr:efflux transporter outer membrane subunit [Gammaproteobacteria bacterium]